MFQLKHNPKNLFSTFVLFVFAALYFNSTANAQGQDDAFEMRSKLKVELQYSDYGEYEYPEPILFEIGHNPYSQGNPYIVDFPEKRFLAKYSRLVGFGTQLSSKYQFTDIRPEIKQHLAELKITQAFDEGVTGIGSLQGSYDTRNFGTVQGGIGGQWEISPITSVQGDIQVNTRINAPDSIGGQISAINTRLKFRQVLTLSTAFQGEFVYYDVFGSIINYVSRTYSVTLSQFLPTQTAVHLRFRYYQNSKGIESFTPSIEFMQYIDWATTLSVKFRYFQNKSSNISLGDESIKIPDGLISKTLSAQINHELDSDLLLYLKYRYYTSSLNIQMNTYMLGMVYSF